MSFLIRLPSLFDSGTSTLTPSESNKCNKLLGVPSFGAGLRPRIPETNKKEYFEMTPALSLKMPRALTTFVNCVRSNDKEEFSRVKMFKLFFDTV